MQPTRDSASVRLLQPSHYKLSEPLLSPPTLKHPAMPPLPNSTAQISQPATALLQNLSGVPVSSPVALNRAYLSTASLSVIQPELLNIQEQLPLMVATS